ncbi:MAG: alanine racemase, partial [Clostridia bacterium]|nr:alanine racemase [Clostridia bacterium]
MKRLELVISMKALLENARAVRRRVPENVKICAVVKADAYGHGAAELSRALESERLADAFAVATPEEGRALREAGVKGEILVLGLTDADGAEESVAFALSQAVDDAIGLAMLERAAVRQGRQARAQLKVDTGMTRLGVRGAGELNALLKAWEHAPHVHMSGMFTHFCFADGDAAFTRAQFERFEAACAAVRAVGFAPVRHAAASTAMLDEAYQLDMVR